jgi:uncharacterized protein YcgI (DUF1989 family)
MMEQVPQPSSHVELRAERNVLAVLSNCPQTRNRCNGYRPTPIRVVIYKPIAAPESV